jgi:hypothetical protein
MNFTDLCTTCKKPYTYSSDQQLALDDRFCSPGCEAQHIDKLDNTLKNNLELLSELLLKAEDLMSTIKQQAPIHLDVYDISTAIESTVADVQTLLDEDDFDDK